MNKFSDSLIAADLDLATNPGHIYQLHRAMPWCPPCGGECNQGRRCRAISPAEACTELGSDDDRRPPATRLGLVLVLVTGAPFVALIVWAALTIWSLR